jgi:NAD-dependent deacetylase
VSATDHDELELFRQMLERSQRVVVFSGAGISTESGIPDFRGPRGLWTKGGKSTSFQEWLASDEVRQRGWANRFSGERAMDGAEPNKGHLAVAKLVAEGKVSAVITQNIDNLHQDSGVPPEKVIELHGNATYARCLTCETRYEMADLEAQFNRIGRIDPCSRCGGIIKTATISFGQAMPVDEMERAEEHTLACDLFIVLGSSLVVYPAAGFPDLAKRLGAQLVIVNDEETPLDPIADLVINRKIGPTMSFVVGLN